MKRILYGLLILVPITLVLEFGGHRRASARSSSSPRSPWSPWPPSSGARPRRRRSTRTEIGALLNATLGNAAELIITIVALREGLVDVVKASIAGSIIGNILVVLGPSLLLGGLKHGTQRFDPAPPAPTRP